jgi:hypothetical protein
MEKWSSNLSQNGQTEVKLSSSKPKTHMKAELAGMLLLIGFARRCDRSLYSPFCTISKNVESRNCFFALTIH